MNMIRERKKGRERVESREKMKREKGVNSNFNKKGGEKREKWRLSITDVGALGGADESNSPPTMADRLQPHALNRISR